MPLPLVAALKGGRTHVMKAKGREREGEGSATRLSLCMRGLSCRALPVAMASFRAGT